jgi:23S rRNA (cytidine1920-2'-O)/16S rRNA (cytidine1409-2'-O)-methyltransferase
MKERLDILVSNKCKVSRSKAQALIMAGEVLVGGKPATKSGSVYDEDVDITVKDSSPYVSRGALKLEKAAQEFRLDFSDKIICDIGASTGGFTDYVLQHGARKVYAIDCGYGQLDQKLRNDPRVINMERTNVRELQSLPEPIDIFVIDVSFISLKKVLPQVITISQTSEHGPKTFSVVALVKPQFEVGKAVADKYKGVIIDDKIRQDVIAEIKNHTEHLGYTVMGTTESPIKGAKGNVEYLLYLTINK